jgi:hypothetical protein
MAEVGLLPFARIALQASKAVLPRYRSRFSKHQFNQPQLLAILCLTRYEDWTFREAEVRLGEHRELRQALGLGSVPDFTTLYRFLQRLDDQTIDQAVGETVRRLRGTHRKARRRARVAVDATGVPATPLSPPCSDRESVQFGEAQALGSCAGPLAAYPDASSPDARIEFQPLPSEASLPFLEDVNRAR